MLAAVDATKERDLGKRFKIEGFPTGKYRRVSIRSSANAITDILVPFRHGCHRSGNG